MQSAPLPNSEEARIAKLNFYQVLDTPPEEAFDRITRIISELIGVPIALVSLVDSERQWFKSKFGLDADETPRDIAFCAHAILQEDLFEVTDPTKDERFYDNPLVVSGPKIRFYAGAPLTTTDGLNLGTLCAIDTKPRRLTKKKKRLLTDFAKIVIDELELRIALKNAVSFAEAEAKQTKLKDEFVSTISHELRTPLTSIQGALGLLRGGVLGDLSEQVRKIIDIAFGNSERLIRLINDILDIERIESGKLRLNREIFDIAGLLGDAVAANESYADHFKVALRLDPVVPELNIDGDRDRLLQVLGNLISNAAKFSPEQGVVKVTAARVDNQARIYVIDNGPGIPEQFKASIFNKFAQADGSDSRKKGGTGLGLNISKQIVEQHSGTIGFETEIGKGTTFYFDLPVVEVRHPLTNEGPNTQMDRDRLHPRVLVCQADTEIALQLQDGIRRVGLAVDIAHDPSEAKKLLAQNSYAGMTTDLCFPHVSGVDLIQEVRDGERTANLPIIVVSASGTGGATTLDGGGFNIVDWIEKPLDEEKLRRAMRLAVQRSSGSEIRILHVEDDLDLRKLLLMGTSGLGEIIGVSTVEDAKRTLQADVYTAIVLDLMLPDGSGETLLPFLNGTINQTTPVIVFSARELSSEHESSVQQALVKSRSSCEELIRIIKSTIDHQPIAIAS